MTELLPRTKSEHVRDWIAVFSGPALSVMGAALVVIITFVPGQIKEQPARLPYIGTALLMILVGLGISLFWIMRIAVEQARFKAGAVEGQISIGENPLKDVDTPETKEKPTTNIEIHQ